MVKVSDEEICDLRQQGFSVRKVAHLLGLHQRTVERRLARLKRKLQIPPLATPVPAGFEIHKISTTLNAQGETRAQSIQVRPESLDHDDAEIVPSGHFVKGVSTLVDQDGAVRQQWIKTSRDQELQNIAFQAALKEAMSGVQPLPVAQKPKTSQADLATLVTLTDCHLGMLAWGKETMAPPWDLDIAEEVLTEVFSRIIDASPASALGIFNQQGDFLHFDSLLPATPSSGHILDADTRYQKMVQAAVRILERLIMKALAKFERVHVLMNEGNHDPVGSVWLRVLFARLFEKNDRVYVELSPNPYQAIEFGNVMLGFHHGHLAKREKLPQIFAAQYAPMWGRTRFRYAHCGHYHEIYEQEHPGIQVLQHPTIASPDAYAARNGYMSKRQAMAITYHRTQGEIARNTFIPQTGS